MNVKFKLIYGLLLNKQDETCKIIEVEQYSDLGTLIVSLYCPFNAYGRRQEKVFAISSIPTYGWPK